MKKFLCIILTGVAGLLFPTSIFAQEGGGVVNPGSKGLTIGDTQNYSSSTLVINGPNIPYGTSNVRDIVFKFASAGKSVIRAYRGDSWGNYLQFLTTGPSSTSTTPIVRMHLDQLGNVGIGTTNPQERLDVSGTVKADILRTQDIKMDGKIGKGLTHPFTYDNVKTDNFSLSWLSDPKVHPDNGYSLWVSSFGGMKFFTQQLPRLTILASGNVGIGTINPQNKLEVDGSIRAKEVIVESGWADFVFDESYNLPSLDEVAAHIKEKKHLPGIPSADEIAKRGVSLGEINTKLLQKIEEQTLYIIDLQEQIREIKEYLKTTEK